MILCGCSGQSASPEDDGDTFSQIKNGIAAEEKTYLDDDGFVTPDQTDALLERIASYAASLREEGTLTDYAYQPGDTCVYMEIDGWMGCLYIPPIADALSGGPEAPQIVTLETVYTPLMFRLAGLRRPGDTAHMIAENQPSFSCSPNHEEGVDALKILESLPGNSIIIWSGHGTYHSKFGSVLCLGGDKSERSAIESTYREELEDKALLLTMNEELCVTPKFFETCMPENALSGSVVYLGSCCSYYMAAEEGKEDSRLVDSILGLGASAVLGNTYNVSSLYNCKMIDSFFEGFADGEELRTVEDALAYAKEKNGSVDATNKSEVYAKCAEGKEIFYLVSMLQDAEEEGAGQTYGKYTVQGYYPDGGKCTVTFSEAIVEERTVTVREFAGGDGGLLGEFENSRVTFISLADTCEVTVPRNIYADRDPNYRVEDDAFYSQAVFEGIGTIVDENHFDLTWYGLNSGGFSNGKAKDVISWEDEFFVLETDQFDTDYCFIVMGSEFDSLSYGRGETYDHDSVDQNELIDLSKIKPDRTTDFYFGNNIKAELYGSEDKGNLTLILSGTGDFDDMKAFDPSGSEPWRNIDYLIIKDGIEVIHDYSFHECSNLKKVLLPNSLECIWYNAFSGCSNLKHISIPKEVTLIWHAAFANCTNLQSIVLSDKVTYIGQYVFKDCAQLKQITIPESVQGIAEGAFYRCEGLSDIYYTGNEDQWNQIKIDGSDNDWLFNATIHYNCES